MRASLKLASSHLNSFRWAPPVRGDDDAAPTPACFGTAWPSAAANTCARNPGHIPPRMLYNSKTTTTPTLTTVMCNVRLLCALLAVVSNCAWICAGTSHYVMKVNVSANLATEEISAQQQYGGTSNQNVGATLGTTPLVLQPRATSGITEARRYLQTTAAAERAALLTAFANIPSWAAATDAPCGAGWNDYHTGWRGIKCDKLGGRVTHM
eukprot:COSAG01_NODE_957_length_12474_cov_44.298182_19_plen_210_part_00